MNTGPKSKRGLRELGPGLASRGSELGGLRRRKPRRGDVLRSRANWAESNPWVAGFRGRRLEQLASERERERPSERGPVFSQALSKPLWHKAGCGAAFVAQGRGQEPNRARCEPHASAPARCR